MAKYISGNKQFMTKSKNESLTNYTGCPATYLMVLEQIKKRWGDKAAKHYDPARNCRTFNSWKNDMGRRVMRGQRALKSVTFIPVEDEHGEVIDCYKKTVNLFYYKQLERVIN